VFSDSEKGKSIEDLNNHFFKMIQDIEPNENNGSEDEPIVRFPSPTFSPIKTFSMKNYYFETMLGKVQINKDIPSHAYRLDKNNNEILPELDITKSYGYEFIKPDTVGDNIYDISDLIDKKDPTTIEIPIEAPEEKKEEKMMALTVKKDWIDVLFSDVDIWGTVKNIFKISL
jgi:hypothetical protein